MTAAGIRVGLGEDGQRDYWSPYGNCDMLDRTWQLAFTHRLRKDRLIEHCMAIATIGGASILNRTVQRLTSPDDRPGLTVGDPADIVLVDGETITSTVMDRGTDRTVIHNGTVVADGLSTKLKGLTTSGVRSHPRSVFRFGGRYWSGRRRSHGLIPAHRRLARPLPFSNRRSGPSRRWQGLVPAAGTGAQQPTLTLRHCFPRLSTTAAASASHAERSLRKENSCTAKPATGARKA